MLSISYVLPVAMLIWLWFGEHLGIKSRVLLSLLLPLLYFLHWTGLQHSKGWPSDQSLPLRFELLSADIVEPNPLKGIKGNIHLWVRPLPKAKTKTVMKPDKQLPMAYILPYSRTLHKKLFETKQRIEQGRSQMGLLYDDQSGGGGASIGGGRKLDFQDIPKQHLPPKR